MGAALASLFFVLAGLAVSAPAQAAKVYISPDGVRHTLAAVQPQAQSGRKGAPPQRGRRDGPVAPKALLAGTYWYAAGAQTPTTPPTGMSANVDVPTVTVAANDHSLVELDLETPRLVGGVSKRQIVELGFNVDPGLYGNSNPHLFVGAWRDEVFLGYNGGGGYTAFTNTCGYTAGQTETAGVSVKLQIIHGGTPSGWWLYRGTCAFGYYPDTTWSGSGITFTSGQTAQAFGEVWDNAGAGTTPTDMGNGTLAAVGPPAAGANIGSILYDAQPSGNVSMTWFKITPGGGATQYNIAGLSGRTGRYGGPGF